MLRPWISASAFLLFLTSNCFGMGSDHPPGILPIHACWPQGLYEAVNQPHRVHGHWVNSVDILYYKGSNSELQEMADKLAISNAGILQIVLHPGRGKAKCVSGERVDSADWSVTIASARALDKMPDRIYIDVWLGGSIVLNDLNLPNTATVRSCGEIEACKVRQINPNKWTHE